MDGWSKILSFFGKYLAKSEAEHVHVYHRDRTRGRHGEAW
jgi:hypothetical protein